MPISSKPAKARASTARKLALASAAKPVAAAAAAKPERAQLIGEARVLCSDYYSGPSPVIHSLKPGKLGDYAARCDSPAQRVAGGSIGAFTARDDSLIVAIDHYADKAGRFDPVALACDLGAISRSASANAITHAGGTFTITAAGKERASLTRARFTKPAKA
jgi:hypothetical protein